MIRFLDPISPFLGPAVGAAAIGIQWSDGGGVFAKVIVLVLYVAILVLSWKSWRLRQRRLARARGQGFIDAQRRNAEWQ